MKLILSDEAQADVAEIYDYGCDKWGVARSSDYIDALTERMHALAASRLTGTTAEEIAPGLRRHISGSHAIWFRVDGDVLRVVRVLQ